MRIKTKMDKFKTLCKKNGFVNLIKVLYNNHIQNKYQEQENNNYQIWIEQNEPNEKELELQKKYQFEYLPKISIIVPMYNTSERYFKELIESVENQTYSNWELCIANGSEIEQEYIKQIIENDERIKYIKLSENKGISDNSNEALKLATGDYIALLDHDDLLPEFSLFEIVKTINANRDVKFIYSDEDKIIDGSKKRVNPNFKPDFAIDTLLSYNYICHFSVFEKGLLNELGGFRNEYDGAQDYDLILRMTEKTSQIVHIPKVLYHWRINEKSVAFSPEKKRYAFENGKKAIEDYLVRNKLEGIVEEGKVIGTYNISYKSLDNPEVSIIIPNIEDNDISKKVDDLIKITNYKNYKIIIVQNTKKDVIEKENLKVIVNNKKCLNESELFNIGAKESESEYIVLCNNNIEILSNNWLETMLGYFQRNEVGIVGTRIINKEQIVKNSGIVINKDTIIEINNTLKKNDSGYMARNSIIQNYNCVTDLLMIKKEDFELVGGLDKEFTNDYKYIDLCLKVRQNKKLVVMNPNIDLYLINNNVWNDKKENKKLLKKWNEKISQNDEYYNPNLTTNLMQYRIKEEKEITKLKTEKKGIFYALSAMLVTFMYFIYNLTITYDSSHYLWLSNTLPGSGNFQQWDVARGPIFPLFIKVCNIFAGENQTALLIGTFIFYLVMIYVCYLIYKNTVKNEKYFTKNNKIILFILFIIFIVFNPIIIGYYHTLLTEFVGITLAILSCYLSWKLIYVNFNDNRKKFIIYTLILGVLTPFAWLLKQPYIGTVIFPVIISAIISFIKSTNIKNLIQRISIIVVCLITLILGIKSWDLVVKVGNVNVNESRTSGSFLANGIIGGIKYYSEFDDGAFDTIEEIDSCANISENDKTEMKKVVNKTSEYKYYKVIDINEDNYAVIFSTSDSISIGTAIKFWFESFIKNPIVLFENYVKNYLATTSVLKIEFNGSRITIFNEAEWIHSAEIEAIGGRIYTKDISNVFPLAPHLEQYANNYRTVNKPVPAINFVMKKSMAICSFVMKIAFIILPICTIISIIALFKTKKKYHKTYTRIIDLINILFVFSLLHILLHSMLGSVIDRYIVPAIIPTFIGLYLSYYVIRHRKEYLISDIKVKEKKEKREKRK